MAKKEFNTKLYAVVAFFGVAAVFFSANQLNIAYRCSLGIR